MEEQKLENVTDEALQKEKQQKSRNRLFGLLVVVNLILIAVIVIEIVQLVTK